MGKAKAALAAIQDGIAWMREEVRVRGVWPTDEALRVRLAQTEAFQMSESSADLIRENRGSPESI